MGYLRFLPKLSVPVENRGSGHERGAVLPHKKKGTIALDADGVLLNFHEAYRQAWQRAFGILPVVRDPQAYWPVDRWEVERLDGDRLAHFRKHFDENFWSTVPAIDGAVDACLRLKEAGYGLVCVSAVEQKFKEARLQNLRECGFPIERVIATEGIAGEISPKAAALRELRPLAFVDDYLPYLRGLPTDIHVALVLREVNGSPNTGEEVALSHSQHRNLAEFASWWLSKDR